MGFYEQRLVQRLRERELVKLVDVGSLKYYYLTQLNLQPIQVHILDNKVSWVCVEAQI